MDEVGEFGRLLKPLPPDLIHCKLLNDLELALRNDVVFLLFETELFDVIPVHEHQEVIRILKLVEGQDGQTCENEHGEVEAGLWGSALAQTEVRLPLASQKLDLLEDGGEVGEWQEQGIEHHEEQGDH